MAFLQDYVTGGGSPNGSDPLVLASTQNRGVLSKFLGEGNANLANGYNGAQSFLSQVGGLYQPMRARGAAANTLYSDALGINGQGGVQRAQAAFQTSPGYQFGVDEATKAAERAASAGGMLSSGNTIDAVTRLASGLANTEQGNWLNRLAGVGGQEATGVQGIAGGLNNQGELAYGYGTDKTGLLSQVAQGEIASNNQAGSAGAATNERNWYSSELEKNRALAQKTAEQQSRTQLLGGILGIIGQGLGFLGGLSDRRTKTDIEKIGTTPGGHNWYRFRFIHEGPDAPLREGVMADEVEAVMPDAVWTGADGFKRVDYGMLA